LSDGSSSDSSGGGASDDESSSSQSSDSSEDEMTSDKSTVPSNSRSNALSMPSLSMPTSLVALSSLSDSLPQSLSNVKSPSLVTNDLKKPGIVSLSLSEDSDSSDDETSRKHSKLSNGSAYTKTISSNSNGKIDSIQKSSAFAPETSKPFPDSMPKFSNGTSSASTFPAIPKFSQLSKSF